MVGFNNRLTKTDVWTILFDCFSHNGPELPKRVRKLEKDGKMLNVNEGRCVQ